VRVDEHTTEIAGAPVFYRSAASSPTPVLYLHGIPTSSDDWTPFLEKTGGIAPDLLGFGRSAKGGHLDYSIAGQADFVESFLSELEIDSVRLVVHDWGAGAGLVFAERHPERIERLVILNALPLFDGFQSDRLARVWRRPVLGELLMGSIPRWMLARRLRAGAAHPDAWPDDRVAAVWEQFDQGTQRAILRLHRSTDESALAALGDGLARIRAPALISWGERDPWLGAGLADGYGERLPNSVVELVPDAGHWPWLDQPAVIDRIATFLERAS
jgi:pimeloyl-ACP methyl ester carboxylesterase